MNIIFNNSPVHILPVHIVRTRVFSAGRPVKAIPVEISLFDLDFLIDNLFLVCYSLDEKTVDGWKNGQLYEFKR